jgi:hypothetical protein
MNPKFEANGCVFRAEPLLHLLPTCHLHQHVTDAALESEGA